MKVTVIAARLLALRAADAAIPSSSGDSPAGSFGFAQVSEAPALGVWGLGVLILALVGIGAALLRWAV